MNIVDFDYHLPAELIAQRPARPRDTSQLLVLHRGSGEIEHRRFGDLLSYLEPEDVVVLNDTRVISARLRGRRHPGGGRAEVLLLSELEEGVWEALVSPGRRIQPGRQLVFGDGELWAEIVGRAPAGARFIRFFSAGGASATADVSALLARLGELPLPPYVHTTLANGNDYQTVYASAPGASAAPTAGLHFTREMLDAVRARVHGVTAVTLHVGVGTFRPVHTENVEDHEMHSERYLIPQSTATLVTRALEEGRRILAIGTSTARALEAAATDGKIRAGSGETSLFIRPGYQFQTVRALLTNFHLPRSTLLLLVCAFAGRTSILRAYGEAMQLEYRFLSFGDAMLIL